MADQKITELSAVVTPDNADTLPTVNGGSTKKITWTVIKAFLKTYFDTLYRAIDYNNYALDTASTDDYTITITTPTITSYIAGQEFVFKAATANTGACTLNVNSIAAIAIVKSVNQPLTTGDILAGMIVTVKYDGTYMQLLSIRTVDATAMSGIVPAANLPTPAFYQQMPLPSGVTSSTVYGTTSSSDGSVLFFYTNSSSKLHRFARDTNTGLYIWTHSVSATSYGQYSSLCVLGNYVYSFIDSGNNIISYRYDLATLANETSITMPAIDTAGSNYNVLTWTDGTYIYLEQDKAIATVNKLSISGTTFSSVSTAAGGSLGASSVLSATMYDGTNNYYVQNDASNFIIYKASNINFSASTTTTKYIPEGVTIGSNGAFIVNIDSTKMYLGRVDGLFNATVQDVAILTLYPVTKP